MSLKPSSWLVSAALAAAVLLSGRAHAQSCTTYAQDKINWVAHGGGYYLSVRGTSLNSGAASGYGLVSYVEGYLDQYTAGNQTPRGNTSSTVRAAASIRSSRRRARGLTRIANGAPRSSAIARRRTSSTAAAETAALRTSFTAPSPAAADRRHKSFPPRSRFGKLVPDKSKTAATAAGGDTPGGIK